MTALGLVAGLLAGVAAPAAAGPGLERLRAQAASASDLPALEAQAARVARDELPDVAARVAEAGALLKQALADQNPALAHVAVGLLRAAGPPVDLGHALVDTANLHRLSQQQAELAEPLYREALQIGQASGEPRLQARCQHNLANIRRDRGEQAEARAGFERAAVFFETAGMPAQAALSLEAAAAAALELQDPAAAMGAYARAAAQRAAAADLPNAANDHALAAVQAQAAGQPEAALAYYGQALQGRRASGERSLEAAVQTWIGQLLGEQARHEQAAPHFAEAAAIYHETGEPLAEGTALGSLGITQASAGHSDLALVPLRRSLALLAGASDFAPMELAVLHALLVSHMELSQWQEAEPLAEREAGLQAAQGDARAEADALVRLSRIRRARGHAEAALEPLHTARSRYRELKLWREESLVQVDLANTYSDLGDAPRGLEAAQAAVAIDRASGAAAEDQAAGLVTLANALRESGRRGEALEQYQLALARYRELGDRPHMGRVINNLGLIYADLGQYEPALAHFREALEISRELGLRASQGNALGNIGMVQRALGQPEEALGTLAEALVLRGETGDRQGAINDLLNGANAYLDLQDDAGAHQNFLEAAAHGERMADLGSFATGYLGAASASRKLGEPGRALQELVTALAANDATGDPDTRWRILLSLSSTMAALERWPEAIYYGKQAINAIQPLRAALSTLDRDLRRSFLGEVRFAYANLAQLLMLEKRLAEAESVLDLLKQDETASYLDITAADAASTRLLLFTDRERGWLAAQAPISARLLALYRERRSLIQGDESDPAAAAARNAVRALMVEYVARMDAVGAEALKPDPLQFSIDAGEADRSRDSLRRLGHGAATLYYLVGTDGVAMMLVTPQGRSTQRVAIERDVLEAQVKAYRSLLQNPARDPRAAGLALYQLLLAPMEAELQEQGVQTLMLSLDGALRELPFAALWDGERWLVERYSLALYSMASRPRLEQAPQAAWRAAAFGAARGGQGLSALPSVPGELRGIVQAAGGGGVMPGVIRLDREFTAQSLAAALQQHYPVLHIASHFAFRPGDAGESFLLLGDGERLSLAQLREPQYRFDGVDLLTLSACETALESRDAYGKELEGLGTLAQNQGASAVLATLWSVADQSTGVFMQGLYAQRQAGGLTKAEAMRRTQRAFISGQSGDARLQAGLRGARRSDAAPVAAAEWKAEAGKPFAHPFYWAPFILMGNWL